MKRNCLWLAAVLALCLVGCGSEEKRETIPPELIATDPTRPPVVQTQPEPSETEGETQPPETLPETVVQPEPQDGDFVRIRDYIPDIFVELPYAGTDNFTGQAIYDFSEPFLRYGTVKKLAQVQAELKEGGLHLKIWDAFRPAEAQFKLWEACPDPAFVANPENGFSSHSRGNTVDITLVYADGTEVAMPTGFDDFTALSDRDYSDCPAEAASYAMLLEQVMESYGFRGYDREWWHYTDTQSYPVDEAFLPVQETWYYAQCNEYITLRRQSDVTSAAITTIPADRQLKVIALYGDFAAAEYLGVRGYVLRDYIAPVIE